MLTKNIHISVERFFNLLKFSEDLEYFHHFENLSIVLWTFIVKMHLILRWYTMGDSKLDIIYLKTFMHFSTFGKNKTNNLFISSWELMIYYVYVLNIKIFLLIYLGRKLFFPKTWIIFILSTKKPYKLIKIIGIF